MMRKLKTQNAKRLPCRQAGKTAAQNLKFLVFPAHYLYLAGSRLVSLRYWRESLIFALCALRFALGVASAQPVSSTELINNAKLYDGKAVVYEGEVIGDVMARGDYAWVNVNDGKNAIGIWIDASLANDIAYKGSYKAKGDWLEITGILHRACPQHGGDLDIHAFAIRKISPGRDMSERMVPDKKNFVIILFAVLCLIWILKLLKRK
ncbi:MAG: DNA-binding protein [Candidatus Omnitrophica bacterium]|nr:DNA-binding protein [Candidatus Omnitrophota bacterium]